MPKSKRNKIVSLTRTDKKGFAQKEELVQDIQECVDKYDNIFVFTTENMRNSLLKTVRNKWLTSRFFFGKNKVMKIAFGRSKEEEYSKNLSKLAECIKGNSGVLFTNETKESVIQFFNDYDETDYPRSGFIPEETIELQAGPLTQFSHPIEPYLRQNLGMPTKLNVGVVTLEQDFTVCTKGVPLTVSGSRILKLLDVKSAKFAFLLQCVWSKGKLEDFTK